MVALTLKGKLFPPASYHDPLILCYSNYAQHILDKGNPTDFIYILQNFNFLY